MRTFHFLTSAAAVLALAPALTAQTISEVVMPQFIQGASPTNNNRSPFAYAVTVTGLTPNATYRIVNQIVDPAVDAATVNGAGNGIYAPLTGNFFRTTGGSVATTGNHIEVTADSTGAFTRWFITEPTGNARFDGTKLLAIQLNMNDGNNGTIFVTRLRATQTITVRNFGATANDLTGLYPDQTYADFTPRNFVLAYDNVAGTGRPLAASFIEDDGVAFPAANFAAYYSANVDGVNSRFGLAVPNAVGVRRIEVRSLSNPNQILFSATRANGVWDTVDTTNLSGGATGTPFAPTALSSINDWALYQD